jgi:hypothetical protein
MKDNKRSARERLNYAIKLGRQTMEEDLKNIEEKKLLCDSMLDTSLVIPQDYRELIIETLMKIPPNDLVKIEPILDRFIFISEETGGAAENFYWQCMAKHRMKTIPSKWEGDKPIRLPNLITFDTFVIILIEHELNKKPREEKMYIVAHELAHVFLKHRAHGPNASQDMKIEAKADRQVKKWGFKVF